MQPNEMAKLRAVNLLLTPILQRLDDCCNLQSSTAEVMHTFHLCICIEPSTTYYEDYMHYLNFQHKSRVQIAAVKKNKIITKQLHPEIQNIMKQKKNQKIKWNPIPQHTHATNNNNKL